MTLSMLTIEGTWRDVSGAPLARAVTMTATVQTPADHVISDEALNRILGLSRTCQTDPDGMARVQVVKAPGAVYRVVFGGVEGHLRCDDWDDDATVPFVAIKDVPGGDPLTPTGVAGGGLTGTYPNPVVAKVRGVTVSATAPTAGQVLTASSGTAAAWTTPGDAPVSPVVFRNRIYSTDYGPVSTASTMNTALQQIAKRVSGGWYNVREFGAVGDGVADDTAAIQAALDGAVGTLYFPPGVYMVSGSGAACLTLTRNLDIVGANGRFAYIRATTGSPTTSILKVSFSENWGFGNVRNWRFENISMEHRNVNSNGLHALHIDGGLAINSSSIKNCWLSGKELNGGYALRIDALFYYSKITENQFTGGVYMNTHDANTIEKCLFTGTSVGVTLNLVNGVRNTTIRECAFITRKEALRIIDGSNVRFLNNQCEQPDVGLSTSEFSAMLVIQGAVRRCENTIIAENNFGGGTNLNRLLYIDNASQTIIEKNNLIAVGTPPDFAGKEIELTANAIYTVVRPDNRVADRTPHNVRTRTAFKAEVIDAGEGTSGVLKDFATANGWNGGDFFKDANGIVHFWETLTPGTLTAGTLIGTLPVGFRPPGTAMRYHTGYTSGGNGAISISPTTGEVKIISMPPGTNLTLPSFPTGTTAPSV